MDGNGQMGGSWGWGEGPPGPDEPVSMVADEEPIDTPDVFEPAASALGAAQRVTPPQQPPAWPQRPAWPEPPAQRFVPNAVPPWQTAAPPPAPMVPQGPAPMPMGPQGPMPMGPPQAAPPGHYAYPDPRQMGVMPQEGSHMLGLSALAVGIGAVLGWRYGGPYGGIAGGLLGGSAVNAFRALHYYKEGTPDGDKEAAVSATYAALTTAVGGWLIATKARPSGTEQRAGGLTPNPDGGEDEDEEPVVEPAGPCALRPVGPTILPPERAWEEGPEAE